MDLWNYLAGGAALGLIAGLWGRIKEIVCKIVSLLIQRIEIDSEVADGHQSVILDQVTNGLAVRMAVLYLCGGIAT